MILLPMQARSGEEFFIPADATLAKSALLYSFTPNDYLPKPEIYATHHAK